MEIYMSIEENKNTIPAYQFKFNTGPFATKDEAIMEFSRLKEQLTEQSVPGLLWPAVIMKTKYTSNEELIESLGGPLSTEELAEKYLQYIKYTQQSYFEPWEMGSEDLPGFREDALRMGFFPEGFDRSTYAENNNIILDYATDTVAVKKTRKRRSTK